IGESEVLVGNFLFDFDCEVMSRVLQVPSEEFRDNVRRSLRQYMTTMKKELGTLPDREQVQSLYHRKCEEALAAELVHDGLGAAEWEAVEESERRLASADFIHGEGGLRRRGVKIHEDVWVRESSWKAERGLVRVVA